MKELPRLGFNPVPGLERMPFGDSMFGPWDVGGVGPDDPPSANGERFFPGNDLHTAMHCIALRTGLQIIVEHDRNLKLPVGFEVPTTKSEAIEVIQSICKACKLDYVEDGNVIIVKKRPVERPLARWTLGDVDGTFNIFMEDVGLVAAIMEVAVAFKVQVFFPAIRPGDTDGARLGPTLQVGITLELKNATADQALRKLAELGDLELEVEKDETDQPIYLFSYKE
ncbi:MAG: hypothetical protein ICCCNLDF_02664 [Planctomycetes bacterium]|nr:hypothetical protein [Planctomycetota bacterium]